MKRIVVIGANEFQKKLVEKAKDLGLETHVFAWEKGAVAKEVADFFYPISIIEKKRILSKLKTINPIGICSIASDLANITVNFIADKLGLVGNTIFCTRITTNKYEMRKILAKHGLPCPYFQIARTVQDISFDLFKFPLIIKPTDRSGSRGVSKVNNIEEAKTAMNVALEESFVKEVLVEEFIEGKEYSVEYISQDDKHYFLQITKKFTTGSPNYIEKGHLSPAKLSVKMVEEIKNIVEKSLVALKVKYGASHSELKITPMGEIKIIEIASRMGGDFIGSDMVHISTGYDFLKNVIKISINERIEIPQLLTNTIAFVGFLFDEGDKNKFREIKKRYPRIIYEYYMKEEFDIVKDSASRNGYYILEIDDKNIVTNILKILNMEKNTQ